MTKDRSPCPVALFSERSKPNASLWSFWLRKTQIFMDQLTDVAEGLNPLLPYRRLLSLSRVHYKKNMSGDASPAQDEKTLPCFISSSQLRSCGRFPCTGTSA